jgi:hypothetical protein
MKSGPFGDQQKEEILMALYDRPRDPQFDPLNDPRGPVDPNLPPASTWAANLVPFLIAAALAIALLVAFYPHSSTHVPSVATNAGPQTQSVNPVPAPSTFPTVPTPNPTTEPAPSQTQN